MENIQDLLHRHFKTLKETRIKSGKDLQVYAIEHNLGRGLTEELGSFLRDEIKKAPLKDKHWLLWVIYASEIGYEYEGDEYWTTFKERTPKWDKSWRNLIRDWFKKFSMFYKGAVPTGEWAKHYGIICWPITHAILPIYLQKELAHLLYDIRHLFRQEHFVNTGELGRFINSKNNSGSSRFRHFTEQFQLVGQIATALLSMNENNATSDYISPDSLKRIIEDLNIAFDTRNWLKETQVHVSKEIVFSGTHNKQKIEIDRGYKDNVAPDISISIEPSISFQYTDENQWEPFIEIPDLKGFVGRYGNYKDVILNMRCFLFSEPSTPLARGRLYYNKYSSQIREWPKRGKPLIQYENAPEGINNLLGKLCRLEINDVSVYKINRDGWADSIKSKTVRKGYSYLVVIESGKQYPLNNFFKGVSTGCKGITVYELDLTRFISYDIKACLQKLGITLCETVDIAPVGIAPPLWDGEGVAEFLSTENYYFRIKGTQTIDYYEINMGNKKLVAHRPEKGNCIIIEIPRLAPGVYKMLIAGVNSKSTKKGFKTIIEIRVRDPRDLLSATSIGSLLNVYVDPCCPSMEDFYDNEVDIEVRGPLWGKVNIKIELMDKKNRSLCACSVNVNKLPIDPVKWKKIMENEILKNEDFKNSYEYANSIIININGEEIGKYVIYIKRKYHPLRWIAKKRKEYYMLSLVDETDEERCPLIERYEIERPTRKIKQKGDIFYESADNIVPSGLYIAKSGANLASIIIPPMINNLSDLKEYAIPIDLENPELSIYEYVNILDLWCSAETYGNLMSEYIKKQWVERIISHITVLLIGKTWVSIEYMVGQKKYVEALSKYMKETKKEADVEMIKELEKSKYEMSTKDALERLEIFEKVVDKYIRFKDSTLTINDVKYKYSKWVYEYILRLFTRPAGIIKWANGKNELALTTLKENPSLVKAARICKLMVDNINVDSRWKWQ